MIENKCPQCGAPIDPGARECKFCGEKLMVQQTAQQVQPQVAQAQQQQGYATGINPSWPVKSKVTAGILGILLGGIGIHKFYMGQVGLGIIYLLFCWTCIPGVIGFVEGIIYLCTSDEDFQLKYHVRIS